MQAIPIVALVQCKKLNTRSLTSDLLPESHVHLHMTNVESAIIIVMVSFVWKTCVGCTSSGVVCRCLAWLPWPKLAPPLILRMRSLLIAMVATVLACNGSE